MYQLLVDYLSKADIMEEKKKVSENVVNYLTQEGRSMPDNAILLDVCLILNISVNELLSGEKFAEEYYMNKAEENMVELVRESEYHKQRGKWTIFSTVFSFLMLVMVCVFVMLSVSGVESLSWFMDMPSIIIPVGITFFVLIASKSLGDFVHIFAMCYGNKEYHDNQIKNSWATMKMVLCVIPLAGMFSFVVSIIAITGHLTNTEMVGPYVSVAMLPVFYCFVMEILLIPTAMKLYRKQK